jgi:hypothetical protein
MPASESKPSEYELLHELKNAAERLALLTELAIQNYAGADVAVTEQIKLVNHLFYKLRLAQYSATLRFPAVEARYEVAEYPAQMPGQEG